MTKQEQEYMSDSAYAVNQAAREIITDYYFHEFYVNVQYMMTVEQAERLDSMNISRKPIDWE